MKQMYNEIFCGVTQTFGSQCIVDIDENVDGGDDDDDDYECVGS